MYDPKLPNVAKSAARVDQLLKKIDLLNEQYFHELTELQYEIHLWNSKHKDKLYLTIVSNSIVVTHSGLSISLPDLPLRNF